MRQGLFEPVGMASQDVGRRVDTRAGCPVVTAANDGTVAATTTVIRDLWIAMPIRKTVGWDRAGRLSSEIIPNQAMEPASKPVAASMAQARASKQAICTVPY